MPARFEGFHYPVAVDGALGRFRKESDYQAYVVQLIKQVLLTAPGERVNRPDFGAGLRRLVFSPSSRETATLLQATVFQSLDRWLGSIIKVDRVDASFENGRLDVVIAYTLKARGDQEVLNLEVTL
ncbi:GPW/gp25 family protein [Methylocaldum marinum]|uniref:GPW/gp25 family protein n=1 Tax=Methylocaldum marinum TaxID=1432792 RepID=A0A250KX10_9GAMM|nr:GPW/gp25 family protein [Methylocaldum marinum]BBA36203.1 GPW/gp25 family protein [Methylocaldum marinum]